MITADDFLTLLVDRVPEARPLVEERYELRPDEAPPTTDTGLDLYGDLLRLLNWPVLQPAWSRRFSTVTCCDGVSTW
ncbi:hypothetical protein ABZ318_37245 [Streptomyces sp. NPDC006197]|uniref:hypothetical protein n=1 Tax=Streptomyces sp. NPDC006197 TaxID=3156685 RepID=UPI0033B92957